MKKGINEMEVKNVQENTTAIFRLPKYTDKIDIAEEVGQNYTNSSKSFKTYFENISGKKNMKEKYG